ncbi:MAG: amidase domain-containing protein [Oscillospiraceae bacterium]|nr:amidase domain-containing protein [Oscillospiraceae bacterium]
MKILAVLLIVLALFGCAPANPTLSDNVSDPASEVQEPEVPEETNTKEQKPEPEPEPKPTEVKFTPPVNSSPKAAVMRYFSALYDSYIAMLPVDISPIIDLDYEMMQNVLNWNDLLAMRRRLIAENGYCYVETERFDYEIEYIKQRDLDDERMYYVDLSDYGKNATVLHFVIKGEEGKAYPPIFALNSQHSVIVTEEDGQYKIAYHYFPGSEGKFQNDLPVEPMTEEEISALLAEEFAAGEGFEPEEPKYDRVYDAEAAVAYALEYCEERNTDFYFVGDWYGNCMNFTSQCVWAGFKTDGETPKNYEGMNYEWYCGKGGGTLIWTSVSRFWNWIQEEKSEMQTAVFYNVEQVKAGDIVNIGSYACLQEEKYTHALVVVDEERLILAQNSPANFIYYSDLANNYSRFIRPVSLNA